MPAKKDKIKQTKLVDVPGRPYYGIKEIVPKGFRRATMQEAIENDKISYWGLNKVDNRMLDYVYKNSLPDKEKPLVIQRSGVQGRIKKLEKELRKETDNIKKHNKNLELKEANRELKFLNIKLAPILKEKKQKMLEAESEEEEEVYVPKTLEDVFNSVSDLIIYKSGRMGLKRRLTNELNLISDEKPYKKKQKEIEKVNKEIKLINERIKELKN